MEPEVGEELTTEERSRIRRERLAERNAYDALRARSSLASPGAQRIIQRGIRENRAAIERSLTGVPEEQADWEADD